MLVEIIDVDGFTGKATPRTVCQLADLLLGDEYFAVMSELQEDGVVSLPNGDNHILIIQENMP